MYCKHNLVWNMCPDCGTYLTPANSQSRPEQPKEPSRGFIIAPTPEQLRPTKREQHLLAVLWDWQEQSAKSQQK